MTRPLAPAAHGASRPRPRPSRSASLGDWARSVLRRPADSRATMLLTVPAPAAPPDALLGVATPDDFVLWEAPGEPAWSGVGIAHELTGQGAQRFEQITEQAADLWPRLCSVSPDGASAPPARLLGGFAFRPGDADRSPWDDFGDARFLLPRLRYDALPGHGLLTLAVRPDEARSRQRSAELIDALLAARDGLARFAPQADTGHPTPCLAQTTQVGAESWRGRVDAISAGIEAGRFEKVVAARRTVLRFDRSLDALAVLYRLRIESDRSIRFAFARSGAAFVGATPERLVSQRGRDVRTEALAGTIRADDNDAAAALLDSPKELSEHHLVLRELVRSLSPVCDVADPADSPTILALRRLLHLRTPVRARRRQPGHVLDLVRRLHPTPAVGGVPTAAALECIAESEPDPRGWYAAPIGCIDAHGDGQFAVALRSGLLRGCHAHLYAGAGIVRHSESLREYAETDLKLATLRMALGVPS